MQDRDIVIVGAGPVGNCLALALSGLGFRLGLVDSKPAPKPQHDVAASGKALALSLSTQRFLHTLGLWSGLAPLASPISAVHVSEQGRFGRSLLQAADQGLAALGFVIDSADLDQYLSAQVQALPDIQIWRETTCRDHREIDNPLVVAADGTHSQLRSRAGIGHTWHDYQQTAIVCPIQVQRPVQGIAYERFTPAGPIAMLPVGERQVKAVWAVPQHSAAELMSLSSAAFAQALQRAFGQRLGVFLTLGERSSYPLIRCVAERLYAERLVLLGNAAATLHPIAAQGLNLAVRDIASLAEVLLAAKQSGAPLGAVSTLRRYAEQRQADRDNLIRWTHQLAQGFDTQQPLIRRLRHWGLVACDVLPALKKGLIKRGVGFQSPLPQLCCGIPLCAAKQPMSS